MHQNCPTERYPSALNWLRRILGILLFTALGYPAAAQETGAIGPAGPDQLAFSVENMMPTVSPGQDFYTYAAGAWLKRVERPERHGGYGFFEIVADRVEEQMRQVLKQAADNAKTAPKGSPAQQVGTFYKAYMNVDARNAAGWRRSSRIWMASTPSKT